MQTEALRIAEPAIDFQAGYEILGTEIAVPCGRLKRQGTADACCIAELPGVTGRQILSGQWVDGKIPTVEISRKDQLKLKLMIMNLLEN